jgi:hypothetical protein
LATAAYIFATGWSANANAARFSIATFRQLYDIGISRQGRACTGIREMNAMTAPADIR